MEYDTAYDYQNQVWITGPAALPILIEQARATISALVGPNAAMITPPGMTAHAAKVLVMGDLAKLFQVESERRAQSVREWNAMQTAEEY